MSNSTNDSDTDDFGTEMKRNEDELYEHITVLEEVDNGDRSIRSGRGVATHVLDRENESFEKRWEEVEVLELPFPMYDWQVTEWLNTSECRAEVVEFFPGMEAEA